ncbi:MAG: mobile mystery protein A [Flavobacteriales bacterium]|nr:mobile mystery protein A [Flavobacteriales bacterium]
MDKRLARKTLDQKLSKLPSISEMSKPHKGWIKAVRESIGMTTSQLSKRLGVTQARVSVMEKAEVNESLTLASLKKAAEAMNCALVYHFVPHQTLEEMVQAKAKEKALRILRSVDQTMALEDQSSNKELLLEELEEITRRLIEERIKEIWNEES